MKTFLKVAFLVTLAAAMTFGLATITSEPASAYVSCPSSQCPSNLSGYSWAGSCIRSVHGCPEPFALYKDTNYPAYKCWVDDGAV